MKGFYKWLLFIMLVNGSKVLTAQTGGRGELCLLWYNVENLFYPDHDTLSGDQEFTPEGSRHWTWSRYRKKLTGVAKVIVASGRGEAPEIVGLCEVENARVLEDLIAHPILVPYDYAYFHSEGPDHRGMEVACLCRASRFKSLQWKTLSFGPQVPSTRDMMCLSVSQGADTLDLFLVHLVSKYSGAGATAPLRRMQIERLVQCMDSVFACRAGKFVMAVGDFNDEYESYSLEPLRTKHFGGSSLIHISPAGGPGTYKFRAQWSQIDLVLVTQSLLPFRMQVNTVQLLPLLVEDVQFGGVKPFRCYVGYQYQGGISDHLPLVVNFAHSPLKGPYVR